MAKNIDWDSIEVHYRAGARALRDIAAEFGVNESAIRKRAKRYGWIRNPAALKRARVNARLADGAQNEARLSPLIDAQWEAEVAQDVQDMVRGLNVSRACLARLEMLAGTEEDPKVIKTIMEAAKTAVETIRRIRGLDNESSSDEGKTVVVIEREVSATAAR